MVVPRNQTYKGKIKVNEALMDRYVFSSDIKCKDKGCKGFTLTELEAMAYTVELIKKGQDRGHIHYDENEDLYYLKRGKEGRRIEAGKKDLPDRFEHGGPGLRNRCERKIYFNCVYYNQNS